MSFFDKGKLIFSLVGIATLLSCNSSVETTPDHTVQIRTLIDSTRVIIEKHKLERGLLFLDASLSKITNLSIDDKLRIYNFKQRYHYWAGRDALIAKYLNKSIAYSDTIINLIKANKVEDKYKTQLGDAFFNKGDVFLIQKKYEDCYRNYHLGKQLVIRKEQHVRMPDLIVALLT